MTSTATLDAASGDSSGGSSADRTPADSRWARFRVWLNRWWRAIDPAQALAVLRIALGAYSAGFALVRLPYHLDLARLEERRFEPVGVWAWLDQPLPVWVTLVLGLVAAVSGIAFTLGWRYQVTAPVFAAAMLGYLTYGHAWGQILHTEHLLILHLGVLALAPAADRWSLDRRWGSARSRDTRGFDRHRWAIWLMAAVTAGTYFVAGWAKVRNGGVEWITGDVLRSQIAHDNLRKELLGDISSPFAATLLPHAWLFPPMAAFTLVAELGAPLALVWRRVNQAWTAAALGFHWGILALMAVLFPYQLAVLAFLPNLMLMTIQRGHPSNLMSHQTKHSVSTE